MSIIKSFLEKGILISPEIIKNPSLLEKLSEIGDDHLEKDVVIDKSFLRKAGLLSESSVSEGKTLKETPNVNVLFSYNKQPGKISVTDFVVYFNKRFEALISFLRQRKELHNITSISRVKSRKGSKERVSTAGLVFDKSVTKTNKIVIKLEDTTGVMSVVVSDRYKDAYDLARELVLDEAIGVEGVCFGDALFANKIFVPDIPLTKELKKGPEEEYLAVLGDPHFGSNVFLTKEFEDFVKWINQEKGSEEQKEMASKIRYLVIIGDLVEGVGVYPAQEKDLEIKDIQEQYDLFTNYLKKIPKHIQIIVCPGNHDAGRISEPQPPLFHKYTSSLQKIPNLLLLSNPSFVNIGATNDFPGFDLLLYHGYSLIYYADNVESIRTSGGQKRPDLIMKFLLQKRHLAPTHTSNLYVPDIEADPLVINQIPDFFITGHIHRISVSNYKNITLINGSSWTGITENQEKRGLEPQPAKLPIINLKTREVKIINFLKSKPKEPRPEEPPKIIQNEK
ncbi:metallophosphoesterase [Candidatus Woesearchaeota archaeon]|nr:metallophosphoesterase [Candidatus Woesearchaeota archaeon]